MSEHLYISAAAADAPLVTRLRQQLQQAGFVVWVPPDTSTTHLPQAIQLCWALLVVVSPHSINAADRHSEWRLALRFEKPLLPLVIGDVSVPPLLRRRRPITLSTPDRIDIPGLVQRLTWLRSPRGELQTLRDRLADLELSLARGQASNPETIRAEIDRLQRQIGEREQVLATPVPQPIKSVPTSTEPIALPTEPALLPSQSQPGTQRHED